MFYKQADDDKNFEPLYAEKSHLQPDLTMRQPFLTIPNYGHFGQKMDFPIDFIFWHYTFSKKTRNDKNFERPYDQKSQYLADLATKSSKICYFWPEIWPNYDHKSIKKLFTYFIFWKFWKERVTTISGSSYTRF